MVDAVVILLHPILGFSMAIWLYRQWKIMKALKTKKGIMWSKIQNKERSEIVNEHEVSGRRSLLFISIVIFFATAFFKTEFGVLSVMALNFLGFIL